MATVLAIAQVSQPNNDLKLKFKQFLRNLQSFGSFKERIRGVLSSQAEGLQARVQGVDLGVLASQAEGLQTGLQGSLFCLKKKPWLRFQIKSDRAPRKGPWGVP